MHIFKMGKTIKEEEEKRKSQIVSLSWNLVPRLIRICRIYLCSHFLFSTGNTLLGQIWSKKNQNCQFKPKLCTKSNSNMQNAIVIFIFFFFFRFFFVFFVFLFVCLRLEIFFLGKFGPKNQSCQFKLKKLKFGYQTMQKLFQLPNLTRICRIKWSCSFYLAFKVEISFLGKFGPKN